jgi:beta-lactam-binding protein with PASTA domain
MNRFLVPNFGPALGHGHTAQATDTVIYSPTKQQTFCIVPNVTHNKLAKAKAALKKAGCKVGKIKKVHSSKFRKGTVEHASNSANVVLKAGTKVGLTESIGKAKKSKKHSERRSHMR